jgi:PAS domain S-box-containing protein
VTEERRAEEVRRRLAAIVESSDDAILSKTLDGIVTSWNRAAELLYGYTAKEIVGKHVATLVPAERRAELEVIMSKIRRGEVADHFQTIRRRKDGTLVEVSVTVSPMADAAGQLIGASTIARDISERSRAERELRESEARKASIFDAALDCIITIDSESRIVEFNRAAERTFGYQRSEVLGQQMAELIVPPTLRERHYRGLAHYLATGEGPVLGNRVEMPALRADGSEFPVELAITAIHGNGAPLFTACLRDLSDVKRIESRRAARMAVTQILSEASALAEAAPHVLQLLCETLGWHAGAFWQVDEKRQAMHCVAFWHAPSAAVREFESATRNRTFAAGVGLPGRVWTTRQPAWIPDVVKDDNFPRGPVADREELHGAFGVPVVVGPEFLGVIEFFSREIREPDPDLLEMMATIGGQIGQFIERRRAERDVQASEERLRLALDAGRMGTWEWNIQTNAVAWSPGLEALHGLAPGSFCGTFDGYQQDIHPDDLENVRRSITRTLETGGEHHVEYRIVCPDGSQRWVEDRGKLFRDEQGKPLRMIGVCIDIDQRKLTEHTTKFLADASATLAGVVDYESTLQKVARLAVPFFADWSAVDMLDDDGRLRRLGVAHVDPAKVQLAHELQRRYPPDPAAPQGLWNIIRTGQAELISEITDEMLASHIQDPEEQRIIRELGLKSYIGVPLSVRGKVLGVLTFITAEGGRRYGADDLRVAEDLANRAAVAVENSRLYHALREADRRKDEFLALLGHELRNPLAPISNALHVLKLPQSNDQMRQQAREMLERQVEHMVRLVDDLLDVSRIMRGKVELRREPVELGAVVARAVETVKPVIDAEGHRFELSLSRQPLWVNGDLLRLAQVVANLLHNAAKYTEKGGYIGLSTAQEDGQAVIRVRDTGIGLTPDMLARIFEMFFQAERRTKDSHGGLGIGLSLVRGLVELHGGSVDAHSAGPGAGSEFIVRLPMVPIEQVAAGGQLRRQEATERPAPRRILVVDDNTDAADSLAMLLRLLKQDVLVAYDGHAALAQAEENRPTVAFVDLGMPRMDGYELARLIRAHPELKDMVLVALTGWGQPEDRQRTKDTGFDHHLVKPVDADTLRQLLSEHRTGGARR